MAVGANGPRGQLVPLIADLESAVDTECVTRPHPTLVGRSVREPVYSGNRAMCFVLVSILLES